ncbi:MAG: metallophosphatase family protein [Planctomycetota bacterium]|nr:metallophosphatase family protein [Planctomycetota bacterium]
MPRQAIISDIHGNLVALDTALKDCADQKVDSIVCIGDLVGYGPDPLECVDRVRERCAWTLCGNHDVALFMTHPVGMNKIARNAIIWQRSLLEPKWYSLPEARRRWAWLKSLGPQRQEENVLYVHASPRDPLIEYVEEGDVADMGFGPSQKIVEIFEKIPWLSFCGHSHKPGVITQDYYWIKPHELEEYRYKLPGHEKTLVNIGSVGQPRDRNPELCYAIYDSAAKTVQFRRVPYDIKAAQARFKNKPALHEKMLAAFG